MTTATGLAPSAGQRVQRTAGQAGVVLVAVQLWQAFEWFGAAHWTAEEAALRWPAITAAGYVAVAGAQNLVNWWKTERHPAAVGDHESANQAVTIHA